MESEFYTTFYHCVYGVKSDKLNLIFLNDELGIVPDDYWSIGQEIYHKKHQTKLIKTDSIWKISSKNKIDKSAGVNEHLQFIINKLNDKIDKIIFLKRKYELDTSFWIWVETEDGGAGIDFLRDDLNFISSISDFVHISVVKKL